LQQYTPAPKLEEAANLLKKYLVPNKKKNFQVQSSLSLFFSFRYFHSDFDLFQNKKLKIKASKTRTNKSNLS
jgi:hypothetical protein